MGMLERIKKKQLQGFKEFVLNLETTISTKRRPIILAGILEDPIYMSYVIKNVRTFEDFLSLSEEELNKIFPYEDLAAMVAMSLQEVPEEKIKKLETLIPKYFPKIQDELSYLKESTLEQRERAHHHLLSVVRKYQEEKIINAFDWHLPPDSVYSLELPKEGVQRIFFDNGKLAAEGQILKTRRQGHWRHYYENGALLAEGEYQGGLKQGKWVFYYANGALKSQGHYLDDLRQGLWSDWERSGVESQGEFIKGIKQKK
jgi:hypothetical protein